MEISAVSASRTSPTIMTSGSWRKKCLNTVENVLPFTLATWTCSIPSISYSTGSSTVRICGLRCLTSFNKAYIVVDLPEPVGPVTKNKPCGRCKIDLTEANSLACIPSLASGFKPTSLSRIRITTLSPRTVGITDMRRSITFCPRTNRA